MKTLSASPCEIFETPEVVTALIVQLKNLSDAPEEGDSISSLLQDEKVRNKRQINGGKIDFKIEQFFSNDN